MPLSGNIDGGTFLIKRVATASSDLNDPAWLRNNKSAYFDYQGQEVSLDNTTSTFTLVDPVASSYSFSMPSVPSMSMPSVLSMSMPSLSMPSVPSMTTLSLPNFSTSVKPSGGKRKRTKRLKRKCSRKTKLIIK